MLSKFRQAFYTFAGTSQELPEEAYDYNTDQRTGRLARSASFRGFSTVNGSLTSSSNQQNNHSSSKKHQSRSYLDGYPSPTTNSLKFKYWRPVFLQLKTDDEIIVSADQQIRPIILPRDTSRLPWNAGYAEAINAGKSQRNEDQAHFHCGTLTVHVSDENIDCLIHEMGSRMDRYDLVHRRFDRTLDIKRPGDDDAIRRRNDRRCARVSRSISMIETVHSSHIPTRTDLTEPNVGVVHELEEMIKSDSKEEITSDLKVTNSSQSSSPVEIISTIGSEQKLPWIYFGIFDGHAGSAVAVAATNTLHKIIAEKLESVALLLLALSFEEERMTTPTPECIDGSVCNESVNELKCTQDKTTFNNPPSDNNQNLVGSSLKQQPFKSNFYSPGSLSISTLKSLLETRVTIDNLITGALESSFWAMDELIGRDKDQYKMPGGCTALVAIFILGRLYVSNAGDSRAIVYKKKEAVPMSFDFTPNSERDRIKRLAMQCPQFLGNEFTYLEFFRKPTRQDIGKQMLYKIFSGWSYKTITHDDLRIPLIHGEGKRSRVLATIGVTRGFGDHELKAQHSDIHIKPFLTPEPEVKVLPLADEDLTSDDVLILGTDGLWDVTTNNYAGEIVQKSFDQFPDDGDSKYRYISAAQDLVMHARGRNQPLLGWRAVDDITAFVVPLKPYRDEYNAWRQSRVRGKLNNSN
ncbi:Protein phosphatase 1H [Fragariocoptes setiger]|uniref:Protein phosphatase 1H n=1 Tax=Fragariocoptes setiger TaxID=1670756 RepID=A0ABQ7S730_9ACAR|nr:Protein phosphatase 1H [Fragariocoptes setiger]